MKTWKAALVLGSLVGAVVVGLAMVPSLEARDAPPCGCLSPPSADVHFFPTGEPNLPWHVHFDNHGCQTIGITGTLKVAHGRRIEVYPVRTTIGAGDHWEFHSPHDRAEFSGIATSCDGDRMVLHGITAPLAPPSSPDDPTPAK